MSGMLSRRIGARIIPSMRVLERGSVHIWRVSLSLPAEELARREAFLSIEERGQCSRLVRAADRARCIASRGSLRAVIAMYLDEDPGALTFTKGSAGKPVLAGTTPPLHFNVSNTEDLGLVAVTRDLRVGIDIERIRDVPDMEGILDNFFNPEETAWVRSRRGEERTRAFFLLWTRREAAAKALGIGLFDCFARVALPAPDVQAAGFRIDLPGSADARAEAPGSGGCATCCPAPGCARRALRGAGERGALVLETARRAVIIKWRGPSQPVTPRTAETNERSITS